MKPPKQIYAKVEVINGEEVLRLSTSPFLKGNIIYKLTAERIQEKAMSFTDERLINIYASLQNCHHFTDEQIEKLGLFAEQASVVVGESPTSIIEKINNQLNDQAVQEPSEALFAKYLHPRIYDTLDGYNPKRKKHGKTDAQRKKETAKRHKRNKNKKTHRK